MPRRVSRIADYLIKQGQHFFPAIVVGVTLGEPTWYEIDVEDQPLFGFSGSNFEITNRLGLLELDGTEELYAIDGQHRIAGIREALRQLKNSRETEEYERLANESLSVIFVSADIRQPGYHQRVRRLFSTLNKEAKRVSIAETIALDEDDAAAIVTRWLATQSKLLNKTAQGRSDKTLIQLGRTNEIRLSNRHSITTIVALYRFVERAFQSELTELRKEYDVDRPDEERLENLYNLAKSVWENIAEYDLAIADVAGSDPAEERASTYRSANGGHILFRPVGLQAFSGALGVLRSRGIDTARGVRNLCTLPRQISQPPWSYVLWNPNTRRMINSNNTVAEALFLHMLGENPRSAGYDLRGKYDNLLRDDPDYNLDCVPIVGLSD